METWLFEQSSCWKYYRLVGEIWTQSTGVILKYAANKKMKGTLQSTPNLTTLPILNSSSTCIISECHSSLNAKQNTDLE